MAGVDSASVVPIPFLDLVTGNAQVREEIECSWKSILAHGRFLDGPEVDRFEREFAAYCEVSSCVGVANGTDGLELILRALGIGRGDEVIVPTNTFVATAEAVCAVGARPRFVDVRPDTLLMDAEAVAEAVTGATAGIILVHLFGQMVDSDQILAIADRHGLAVVEDAAQAHGARFAGRRSGGVGVAAAFSFYPGKNLGALSNAGAVVSDDTDIVDRVRSLANHGRAADDRHRHEFCGRNSRLDSMQAAVLSAKLRHLDANNERRAEVMALYARELPPTCVTLSVNPSAVHVYHLAVVRVPDRLTVTMALDHARIGWGVHYPVPCHLQPAFARYRRRLPIAEKAARQIVSLPLSPTVSDLQIRRVCRVLGGIRWRTEGHDY